VTGMQEQVSARRLTAMEIFAGLPQPALRRIAASGRVRRLAAQTRVFSQGNAPARAHVVIDGAVRILQTGRDGEQALMRFIAPGEMFGAVALFTDGRYPADAVTMVETLEVSWSEPELLALTRCYPDLAINALRIVGRRLRIAHALVRLARQGGHDTPNGTRIAFPLRRKDVADISGTTLYTASRILTSWEKTGLLQNEHRHLTLLEPGRLLCIAEDAAV